MPRTIIQGKRGGNYYINKSGGKVYVKTTPQGGVTKTKFINKTEKRKLYSELDTARERAIQATYTPTSGKHELYRMSKMAYYQDQNPDLKDHVKKGHKRRMGEAVEANPTRMTKHKEYAT
jgi:hypothetical protein